MAKARLAARKRQSVFGPQLREGGVVVTAGAGEGWSYEVVEWYSLQPLRSGARRAELLVRKLLDGNAVTRQGIHAVGAAIGLAPIQMDGALEALGATPSVRRAVCWYTLDPTTLKATADGAPSMEARPMEARRMEY